MGLGLGLWFGLIFCTALMVLGIVVGGKALYEKRTLFVMEAPHRDKSGAVQGRLRSAINVFFQLVIIAIVGSWLLAFSDIIWFWLHRLVPEVINVFTPGGRKVEPIIRFATFGGGVVGPGLAASECLHSGVKRTCQLRSFMSTRPN